MFLNLAGKFHFLNLTKWKLHMHRKQTHSPPNGNSNNYSAKLTYMLFGDCPSLYHSTQLCMGFPSEIHSHFTQKVKIHENNTHWEQLTVSELTEKHTAHPAKPSFSLPSQSLEYKTSETTQSQNTCVAEWAVSMVCTFNTGICISMLLFTFFNHHFIVSVKVLLGFV